MERIMQVSRREDLLCLDAIDGLTAFLRQLGLPRRQVLNWLTDVIFGWVEEGGVILDGEGNVIEITPDIIDDAHGEEGSCKWISDVQRRGPDVPRRKRRQSMWLRMALYDAAARITTGRSLIDFSKEEDA